MMFQVQYNMPMVALFRLLEGGFWKGSTDSVMSMFANRRLTRGALGLELAQLAEKMSAWITEYPRVP